MNSIQKKYLRIERSGRKSLRTYQVEPFTGFDPGLGNRFGVAALFTSQSQTDVKRLAAKVEEIGGKNGITFFTQGKDIQIHSTLLEGEYQGTERVIREVKFSRISNSGDLNQVLTEVPDTLTFDRLLLDQGNVLLAASLIPETIIRVRTRLQQIYLSHNLKPLLLDDILHITLARMTIIPPRMDGFTSYVQMMLAVKKHIRFYPLQLSMSGFYKGNVLEFLSKKP